MHASLVLYCLVDDGGDDDDDVMVSGRLFHAVNESQPAFVSLYLLDVFTLAQSEP